MRKTRWIGAALVLGLVTATVQSGDANRRVLRPSTCTPTVSGAPAAVFDGSVSKFWKTPGWIQQQIVTIDLGCTARVARFRRHMTCDGTATSGSACNSLASDGKRHLGAELVRFSPAPGQPTISSFDVGATGWETYRRGGGYDSLPYGWSPWLDLNGATARTVEFVFVDLADALNEIEIEYEEGTGATPGVSIVYLDLPLNGSPGTITVGPDRALWFDEGQSLRVGRLTTTGDLNEFVLPGRDQPSQIVTGPDGALWFYAVGRESSCG